MEHDRGLSVSRFDPPTRSGGVGAGSAAQSFYRLDGRPWLTWRA
jgi:hypothetical protein